MRAALLLVLFGCTHVPPAIGDRCAAGAAHCLNFQASLACKDGALALFPCSGPKGCAVGADRAVMCDQSQGMAPGEICFPAYEGKGQCMTSEPANILHCAKGSWVKLACPEGTACQSAEGDLVCR